MPIRPPNLDDRSFDDLVAEALSRIPAHTPEWTHARVGDPGRTIVELFAWLTDTLLYRANLIPERQRLAFLRLLGVQMRPALPAKGIVTVSNDPQATQAVMLQPLATIKGVVNFETRAEMTVFPVTAELYYKRLLAPAEAVKLADIVQGLQQVYQLQSAAIPYVTTPIFAAAKPDPQGFDLIKQTVDQCLWIAILAAEPKFVDAARLAIGTSSVGGQPLLNVGVMPAIAVPDLFEEIGTRARIPHVWEISTGQEIAGVPQYLSLNVIADSTSGLTRRGVIRLAMPSPNYIGAPTNDVRTRLNAGTGDRPPRIDAPEVAARLVTWLRLRPSRHDLQTLSLSWMGINAIEIDQRQTLTGRVIGESDGSADQEFQLPGQAIEPETLQIQVEETGRGYQPWVAIDDLALAGQNASVYRLDSEAGTIRFGNGVQGQIPETGRRIRVALMRSGGGIVGNLPANSLNGITAKDVRGTLVTKLKVQQPLPMQGGVESETLAEAETRIPGLFRHRDRAVTADDYQRLAAETPGVRLGRVEVLPRFKPQQRRFDIPGVVSVMVLPFQESLELPNPRVDRPLLESVQSYLDSRRPLATELYVIGCEYVPIGVSVGVQIQNGFGQDGVLLAVRKALQRFLFAIAPGGIDEKGWSLGRTVKARELEVVVARVPGVLAVLNIRLFQQMGAPVRWQSVSEVSLAAWQLPELLAVVVVADEDAPETLTSIPFGDRSGVAVPVVPEVC
ncbi:MAG: putative baseplate assembly protein [Candidatus Parcubacteria bacterium]|nr:putative baseplate assembly protein [Leptolyngbyaceae cyanobacterium LF-bin-113]